MVDNYKVCLKSHTSFLNTFYKSVKRIHTEKYEKMYEMYHVTFTIYTLKMVPNIERGMMYTSHIQ